MEFKYISDLHRDSYFKHFRSQKEYEEYIFGDDSGGVLFILGDVADRGSVLVETLRSIRKRYDRVIFVAGNHDLYIEKNGIFASKNALEKAKILQNELTKVGVDMLNGEVLEIENIKIGGSHMWYSPDYLKLKLREKNEGYAEEKYLSFWQFSISDSKMIGQISPIDIYEKEIKKLENLKNKVDIFLSHVSPIPLDSYIAEEYRGSDLNTFFTFDGRDQLENGVIKHFFYGHTHSAFEGDYAGVKLHCNPVGRPGENAIGYSGSVKKIIIN